MLGEPVKFVETVRRVQRKCPVVDMGSMVEEKPRMIAVESKVDQEVCQVEIVEIAETADADVAGSEKMGSGPQRQGFLVRIG